MPDPPAIQHLEEGEKEKESPHPKKEKKVKLSKEEKRRLKVLAALELKKKLIRDELLREIALTNKSLKRGKPLWEGLCGKLKIKELQDEMKEWGLRTEHILEKKDEKIQMLMKNIEDTHEFNERNFSQHLDQLEYLTNCHQTLIDTAKTLYEMQGAEMVQDFFLEYARAQEMHQMIKLNNENIIHMSNVVAKERLRQNYETYMVRTFDVLTTQIEKRYILRNQTIEKMTTLQENLLIFMKLLEGDMVDVRKTGRFLHFMERQRNYVRESNKLNETERNSQKTIFELQQQYLSIDSEMNRKIYGLKLEQAYFCEVRSIIKNNIARDKQLTHEKLIGVASESHRVVNELKEIVKHGELLLSVAECCRKYQTEKEKVVPWSFPHGQANNLQEEEDIHFFRMSIDLRKLLDISEEELAEEMSVLKKFFRRVANTKLHNILLMEERRKLNEENEKYRNIIRSMKKSDDVAYILESLQIKQL